MNSNGNIPEKDARINEEHIRKIRLLASDIRYGTITLVFQDGKLIQIDRNEKIRL